MRVLELGSYVIPAYAGMILREQGHDVEKWWTGDDPILHLEHGRALWDHMNAGKHLVVQRFTDAFPPDRVVCVCEWDVVIDNIRADTWAAWGYDIADIAHECDTPWVSMRDDLGGRSFDAFAQARATADFAGWVPFYLGDTTGGLWLAFKALSMTDLGQAGHASLYQATCLAKLVEGDLAIDVERRPGMTPWDPPGTYHVGANEAVVEFKGERLTEPVRDRRWRLANLRHVNGRLVI